MSCKKKKKPLTFSIDFLRYDTMLYAFQGEWHEENMEINYVHENPKAVLRQEHAAI